MVVARRPFERLSPDEIVVELDHVAVPELPRREVVVLDVRCIEAAADRPGCLAGGRRQPLTERAQLVAGEDGRHGPRDPAQLERVREVGERPDPAQVVCAPASRIASLTAGPSSHGPQNSRSGVAGHRVPHRPDVMAGDRDGDDVRPRRLGQRCAGDLLDRAPTSRALPLDTGTRCAGWRCCGRRSRRPRSRHRSRRSRRCTAPSCGRRRDPPAPSRRGRGSRGSRRR